MKNKILFLSIGIAIVLGIISLIFYKFVVKPSSVANIPEEEQLEPTPVPADTSLVVGAVWSSTKDNTVVLSVKPLASKYQSIAYELTYESQGLIKGVNSGSRPIEVGGKDSFEKEIFLGTCSRNVCRSDQGVSKVSVALEFTDTSGQKSQFTKDYDL